MNQVQTPRRVLLRDLNEGDLCRFVYKQQSGNGQWYQWESTGVFLGLNWDHTEVQVSYRPLAGTSTIVRRGIMEIHLVATQEDRRGTQIRGDERARLPKRFPGAVSPPLD